MHAMLSSNSMAMTGKVALLKYAKIDLLALLLVAVVVVSADVEASAEGLLEAGLEDVADSVADSEGVVEVMVVDMAVHQLVVMMVEPELKLLCLLIHSLTSRPRVQSEARLFTSETYGCPSLPPNGQANILSFPGRQVTKISWNYSQLLVKSNRPRSNTNLTVALAEPVSCVLIRLITPTLPSQNSLATNTAVVLLALAL